LEAATTQQAGSCTDHGPLELLVTPTLGEIPEAEEEEEEE